MDVWNLALQWVLAFVLGWFFLGPYCAFVHELGHTIAVFLFTSHTATIHLGWGPKTISARLGRLSLVVHLGYGTVFGFYRLEGPGNTSARRRALIHLGGPVASLVLTAIYLGSGLLTHSRAPWLYLCALIHLLLALATLYPWNYPHWMGPRLGGKPSDMRQVLILLRGPRYARKS